MRRRRFVAVLAGAVAAACGAASAPPSATAQASSPFARPTPSPSPTPVAPPASTAAAAQGQSCATDAAGHVLFVDAHAHLDGATRGGSDYDGAADVSLSNDDASGAKIEIVMPPPFPASWPGTYDHTAYEAACKKRGPRMAFLGGGGTLNPMIQQAIKAGSVSSDLESRFRSTAAQILAAGAKGFGETAAEHLSFNVNHPYVSAPPDHPLFLLLADIAADAGVPIDLHMFPVQRDNMPIPPQFTRLSPNNPQTLSENVSRFERLLSHNSSARIVWAHAGDTFTGCGTASLASSLLGRHPNLYLQLKADTGSRAQTLLTSSGTVDAAWRAVISSFPERIVLGGDNFWDAPNALVPFQRPAHDLPSFRTMLDGLPPDIACGIAAQNAARLYKLG
jgi:predicted TIM-barrel fold metal-dependent hydrolase